MVMRNSLHLTISLEIDFNGTVAENTLTSNERNGFSPIRIAFFLAHKLIVAIQLENTRLT